MVCERAGELPAKVTLAQARPLFPTELDTSRLHGHGRGR